MSLLTWVLVGVVAYTLGLLLLKRRGLLPDSVGIQGPIVTLHTKRGRILLDKLAAPKRFWRAWANFGVGIALVVMVSSFAFLIVSALSILQEPQRATAVNQPRNVLAIPGVNDFLPLSVAPEIVAGLVIGLIVHEGGHGLLCRVEDIDIESLGLAFFAFVPVGAFVEPEERSQKLASRGARTRMFAAGVTNNFAITIVAFALLFGPVIGALGVAPGVAVGGVLPDSPADGHLSPGDRIVAVDGQPVEENTLDSVLAGTDGREVELTVAAPNGTNRTETVERSVLVTAAPSGDAARRAGLADVRRGSTITTVDGQAVGTERAFMDAIEDREVVTVETADGSTSTFPAGALVLVVENGPMHNNSDAPTGPLVIVGMDTDPDDGDPGTRIRTASELGSVLDTTEPGQTVRIRAGYYENGTLVNATYRVTLGSNPNEANTGFLGIRGVGGVSGLAFNDFGIRTYPAGAYLEALGGDGGTTSTSGLFDNLVGSFFGKMIVALYLPISGVLGAFPFNFPGFTGINVGFYTVEGPLSFLGLGGVYLLANVLFWTGWINVQLGFFNCIPAFPLDGGHILRTSSEAIVSRLPVEASRGMVRTITTSVGVTMLVSFLLLVFGPQLL